MPIDPFSFYDRVKLQKEKGTIPYLRPGSTLEQTPYRGGTLGAAIGPGVNPLTELMKLLENQGIDVQGFIGRLLSGGVAPQGAEAAPVDPMGRLERGEAEPGVKYPPSYE